MTQSSYNQVIGALRAFAERHEFLKTFHSGTAASFMPKQVPYPAMLVYALPSVIEPHRLRLSIGIEIIDLLRSDRSNLEDVLSDTMRVMLDLVSEMKDDEDAYGFALDDGAIEVSPLEEYGDDISAGWSARVEFYVTDYSNRCEVPLSD